MIGRGRDNDAVKRGMFGPSPVAVTVTHLDIFVAQSCKTFGSLFSESR